MYAAFKTYLLSVPVFGVFIMNQLMNKVVLVKSYNGSWLGFPRGKVNQNEAEVESKKSCQTFTGTSEAEAATRGPAKMISKKPMSPIVVADSSSSSSCINTECEILGVL